MTVAAAQVRTLQVESFPPTPSRQSSMLPVAPLKARIARQQHVSKALKAVAISNGGLFWLRRGFWLDYACGIVCASAHVHCLEFSGYHGFVRDGLVGWGDKCQRSMCFEDGMEIVKRGSGDSYIGNCTGIFVRADLTHK